MHKEYILVTNNPLVNNLNKGIMLIKGCDVLDVMKKTRDLIHKGHQLLTHPLSGNIYPARNPYRSLILTKNKENLDYTSLNLIEKALNEYKEKKKSYQIEDYPQNVLKDYQQIDLSLLKSGLNSLEGQSF